jgi:hypothetical protein
VIPGLGNHGSTSEIPGTVVDLFSFVLRIETAIETPAYVVLRLTREASEGRLVMLERLPDGALQSGRRVGLDLGARTEHYDTNSQRRRRRCGAQEVLP